MSFQDSRRAAVGSAKIHRVSPRELRLPYYPSFPCRRLSPLLLVESFALKFRHIDLGSTRLTALAAFLGT
jgi:hypothetical protein